MEKTPNSSAPTLRLVNGPAGRDNKDHELAYIMASNKKIIKQQFAAIAP
jgi:hypothetical protein